MPLGRYLSRMSRLVLANLVVGADGSTTRGGRSAGLSSPHDRQRFHSLRARAECILIGGNTARSEPYFSTPLPLYVMTRGELPDEVESNSLATVLHMNVIEAISYLQKQSETGPILLESGPAPLMIALHRRLVDELFITITRDVSGDLTGENRIDLPSMLKGYREISHEDVERDTFLAFVPE